MAPFPTCSKDGCNGPRKKGTNRCRHHQLDENDYQVASKVNVTLPEVEQPSTVMALHPDQLELAAKHYQGANFTEFLRDVILGETDYLLGHDKDGRRLIGKPTVDMRIKAGVQLRDMVLGKPRTATIKAPQDDTPEHNLDDITIRVLQRIAALKGIQDSTSGMAPTGGLIASDQPSAPLQIVGQTEVRGQPSGSPL